MYFLEIKFFLVPTTSYTPPTTSAKLSSETSSNNIVASALCPIKEEKTPSLLPQTSTSLSPLSATDFSQKPSTSFPASHLLSDRSTNLKEQQKTTRKVINFTVSRLEAYKLRRRASQNPKPLRDSGMHFYIYNVNRDSHKLYD